MVIVFDKHSDKAFGIVVGTLLTDIFFTERAIGNFFYSIISVDEDTNSTRFFHNY